MPQPVPEPQPVPVPEAQPEPQPDTTVRQESGRIASAHHHTCGIRTDDTLVCWGSNEVGQSTPPTTTGRHLP